MACARLAAVLSSMAWAFNEPTKFLIVSSPGTHKVAYAPLTNRGYPDGYQMRELISTGLTNPQGIAIDDHRMKLYVADPALVKLVSYDLTVSGDRLSVGAMKTVATAVETRWVSVDSVGNVFFTMEPNHRIMKISAKDVEAGKTGAAKALFDGAFLPFVSSPGGIAVDNFFVYWTNKEGGTQFGSVMRGGAQVTPENFVANTTQAHSLSRNAVKSYGICLAPRGHVYYTDETANLYGLKPAASDVPTTVSAGFVQPRGCAFDGEGTVFVADKYLNAVYGFAARSPQPQAGVQMLKAVDLEGAFGVAVFQTPYTRPYSAYWTETFNLF